MLAEKRSGEETRTEQTPVNKTRKINNYDIRVEERRGESKQGNGDGANVRSADKIPNKKYAESII